ncbi:MAG: 1-(5-phosphoribosyl)-5-[(5-phosphoribosylamino)methylideneamino]imidazole-4-carboxamide isomerase [Sedimentisphaerales bacterium]|nr:1-(5-phosphoribosyl)-5-[(5-phosphoribosylamino)methylideneamino]imidazole-4-carboxamide isomerase [Sedimentisphaerales bacterium]
MEILPAIDLRAGKCVRLLQGDYDRQIDYHDDPAAQARRFQQTGARWLHVVDLDGAKAGRPANAEVIRRIVEAADLHVEVGGGMRRQADLEAMFAAGVRQVVIGTRALEDWSWFERMVRHFAGRIVLGLDARDGLLRTRGWIEASDRSALEVARLVNDWPLAAIVYTDISRDGMLTGPNVEATRQMAEQCRVPIIASGGVGSLDDVKRLAEIPLFGIIIGRAIYEGAVDLTEALAVVGRE